MARSAGAESFETVPTAIFKTAQGLPSTIKGQFTQASSTDAHGFDSANKGYLVLFWASWCVPCKEELRLVQVQRDKLSRWNVVAVSVDDSGANVRAQGILKSLAWPFQSLYDESGTLFFQINSSGELPLALAFDPQGHLLQVIHELKGPAIDQLSELKFNSERKNAWEITEELHFIQRQRPSGKSEVVANTLGGRFSSANWQVGASQNLIRQKRDPQLGWTRFEDELGPTYLQWQSQEKNSDLIRARLGDDSIEWGKGALISARAIPGTDTNASLQGAHFSQTVNGFSYALTAGRIRQQLFGLLLDPTLDLTLNLPLETAYGFTVNKQFKFDNNLTAKVTAGGLQYQRESLVDTSSTYLSKYKDRRAHMNLSLGNDIWGVDAAHTRYFIGASEDPNLKSSDSSQVDAYLRSPDAAKYQMGATYLVKHDTLPRTFTPVLTEYPATPLTVDGLRSWRVSPRVLLDKWMIEPQWIAEQSTHADDYENQNTYVFQVLNPEREFKSILLYQRHGSNPLSLDAEQSAGVLGLPFSPSLSAQLEYKTYRAKGRFSKTSSDQSGRSFSTQLSFRVERAWPMPRFGQLMLSITRTEQDGYYLATSGIDDRELLGYRVTWTRGPFELRLAACQEPGGLICSGGVCAQRPPLDGFALESKMHWNF